MILQETTQQFVLPQIGLLENKHLASRNDFQWCTLSLMTTQSLTASQLLEDSETSFGVLGKAAAYALAGAAASEADSGYATLTDVSNMVSRLEWVTMLLSHVDLGRPGILHKSWISFQETSESLAAGAFDEDTMTAHALAIIYLIAATRVQAEA